MMSNKRERVKQISLSIEQVLEKRKLVPSEVLRLFGRLQFAETKLQEGGIQLFTWTLFGRKH